MSFPPTGDPGQPKPTGVAALPPTPTILMSTALVLDRDHFLGSLRQDWRKEFEDQKEKKVKSQADLVIDDVSAKPQDADIYVGRTVIPLMALGLERLSKVIVDRQKNPKLMERFNPLRWLAQFLMRHKAPFNLHQQMLELRLENMAAEGVGMVPTGDRNDSKTSDSASYSSDSGTEKAGTGKSGAEKAGGKKGGSGKHRVKGGIYGPNSHFGSRSDWANFEQGRRELLRQKNRIWKVFMGFQKGGSLPEEYVDSVIQAIDESLQLEGALCLQKSMPRGKGSWDHILDERTRTTTFNAFWKWFSRYLMKKAEVSFVDLMKGQKKNEQIQAEWAETQRQQKAKAAEVARKKKWLSDYEELIATVKDDKVWKTLMDQQQLMVTSEARSQEWWDKNPAKIIKKVVADDEDGEGDAGAKKKVPKKGAKGGGEPKTTDELPNFGEHIRKLGVVLKFLNLYEEEEEEMMSEEEEDPTAVIDEKLAIKKAFEKDKHSSWNSQMEQAWELWQVGQFYKLVDGIVDGPALTKFVNMPAKEAMTISERADVLINLRADVAMEKAEGEEDEDEEEEEEGGKPGWQELQLTFGLTMARLEWLHKQFAALLPEGVIDHYPEEAVGLTKEFMRKLMADLLPGITDEEFEEQFSAIDLDGGGEIEFDEFVEWLTGAEVDLEVGDEEMEKPSFEQLAKRFNMEMDELMKIHATFCKALPEGVEDGLLTRKNPIPDQNGQNPSYPENPQFLTKDAMREMFTTDFPDVDDEEFENLFEMVDFDGSGEIEFDEFLEMPMVGGGDDSPKSPGPGA